MTIGCMIHIRKGDPLLSEDEFLLLFPNDDWEEYRVANASFQQGFATTDVWLLRGLAERLLMQCDDPHQAWLVCHLALRAELSMETPETA